LLEEEKRKIGEIKQAKSMLLQLRSWNLIKEWAIHIGQGAHEQSIYWSKSSSYFSVNCTSIIKIGQLILFKETIAFDCENFTKQKNETFCGQNA